MSTSRPFAYNPSPNPPIDGTNQVGDIAIGVDPNLDYFGGAGGVQWWEGPDEELGYIVAKPILSLDQPNPLNIQAGVAFGRSLFTEQAFIALAESLSSGTTFTSGNEASIWLSGNGYWNTWVFITPTPTSTNLPTLTPTPTNTLTPTVTQTPTTSATPGTSPTPTTTNTPTPTGTPPPTPAPQYYYMSPNSWAPPTISQSPGDNFSYTNQPLSTVISTSNLDYTTTSWSFSVWGYPQFEYQSLPGGNFYSTLISLSVPDSSMYPSGSSTTLIVSVSYNNTTSLNDLIVYMSDDLGVYAQWSWEINNNTNGIITGINSPAMWDANNYGNTLNAQRFSNIVISHDETLLPGNPTGSTKAMWNGQLLTLKTYVDSGTYPHIGSYTSLDDTRFYTSVGYPASIIWSSVHPLSINTDNPTYYPLTTLTVGNASNLYSAGVVQPSIPYAPNSAYIWNFDNVPSQHIQCLDKNNTVVNEFGLIEVNSASQPITYTLI
jgi:hypothetical protein